MERYDGSNDGELNDCDVLRAEVTGTKDGIEKEIAVECVIRTSEKWGFLWPVLLIQVCLRRSLRR